MEDIGLPIEEEDQDESPEMVAFREEFLSIREAMLKCQSSEKVTKFLKECLRQSSTADKSALPPQKLRQIVHSLLSSWELSSGIPKFAVWPLLKLPDVTSSNNQTKEKKGSDELSEELATFAINSAYTYALDAEFGRAMDIIDQLRPFLSADQNLAVDKLILLADYCIQFDHEFYMNDKSDQHSLIEQIAIYSPTEADIRRSLVLARRHSFMQAARVMEKRLALLLEQNAKNNESKSDESGGKSSKDVGPIDHRQLVHCSMLYGEMLCCAGMEPTSRSSSSASSSTLEIGMGQLRKVIEGAKERALRPMEAMAKRRLADALIHLSNLDEAGQLLTEIDVDLGTTLAPAMERGCYYLAQFSLARKRWNQSRNEKDKFDACLWLEKAIKVFHVRFPSMATKAYKAGALFGEEIGDQRVRNVSARLFYTTTSPSRDQDDYTTTASPSKDQEEPNSS